MTALATDNFNRANGTLGSNWTLQTGSPGDVLRVVSNTCQDNADTDCTYIYTAIVWPNDQYAQANVDIISGSYSQGDGPAVCVRMVTGSHTDYEFIWNKNASNNAALYKHVAGSSTNLGSLSQVGAASNDLIRLEIQGSTLQPKVNGTALGGGTTDSAISSGSAGLFYSSEVGDGNLTHIGQLDNWEGGQFSSSLGQTASATSTAASQAVTFPKAVVAGSFLVAMCAEGAITNITGVSDSVNGAWSRAAGFPIANGVTDEVDCWVFAGSAAAALNTMVVTVTYAASLLQSVHIAECRMTTTPGQLDIVRSNTGVATSSFDTATGTPSNADAILLACTESSVAQTTTWVAGTSVAWALETTTQTNAAMETFVQTSAASRHGDMSAGTITTWVDAMIAVIPGSAAGAAVLPALMRTMRGAGV